MNYFDILGVPENATDKQIKIAYRKLVKKYHPDTFQGDKSFAEKKIKEINLAYDVLADKAKRNELINEYNNNSYNKNYSAKNTVSQNYSQNGYSSNKKTKSYNSWDRYSVNNSSMYSDNFNYNKVNVNEKHSLIKAKTILAIIIFVILLIVMAVCGFILSMKETMLFNPFDIIIFVVCIFVFVYVFYNKRR